ncbi:GNAT family N-acetyltransferase [Litorihabitans aurantiacus]|uniref:GNAT family N-acetyltransferase n=1 Tax=Litorihabitans aurantiacus TaxID=1930061 RepID=A0AA37XE07_9MICO|nr:GNAT family N-acetyltransferase [Litorihabitans aurantiacus]GMA31457.1 GNAT family N-acetyltransferase [Litorihabitans aurantiacus]
MARYDRVEPDRAEVAFNVADTLQGRGLGSVLLEHLSAAARERGVRTFVADVLPGNARMIRVFTDAGYEVAQRYEDGVISLEFHITATQASRDVVESREQRTDSDSMRSLLSPEGVVVVAGGVEAELALDVATHLTVPDGVAVTLVGGALADLGTTEGTLAVADLAAARAAGARAQLAVVSGAPAEVISWLDDLAALGVRGVVVLSGRFDDEAGTSQRDLLAAVRERGMRLVGPRSFGVMTEVGGQRLAALLWPQEVPLGPTALFCQSPAAAQQLMTLVRASGVGVDTFVTAGHRADVSGNDLLQYVTDDPHVRAVGMYLESLGNPRKFARVARRVSARIPVVAVVGASYGVAGPDGDALGRAVVEETMLAAGVLVADSMRSMLGATQLLAHAPLPRGNRIAVLSSSVSLADLAAAHVQAMDRDPEVRIAPRAPDLVAAATALAGDPGWDTALVLYQPPLRERDPAVMAALAALADTGRTVLAVVLGVTGVDPELTAPSGAVVPAYESVEEAVAALTLAATYAHWRRADHGALVSPDDVDPRRARTIVDDVLGAIAPGEEVALTAAQARDLLGCFGVEVLPTREVRSAPAALVAARELGWPVAVKSTVGRLRHRADLGGVRLDISGPIDLVEAVRQVRGRQSEDAAVEIQHMAPLGVACVVRAWEDTLLGPVLSLGLSGDASELLGDATYAVPPLRTGDVHRLVTSLRAAPRLFAPQQDGRVPDVAALEDLLARVAALVEAIPSLRRLDLLPVLVSPSGAVALRAEVVLAATVRPDGSRRALRG